jgi:hypothetical protein
VGGYRPFAERFVFPECKPRSARGMACVGLREFTASINRVGFDVCRAATRLAIPGRLLPPTPNPKPSLVRESS